MPRETFINFFYKINNILPKNDKYYFLLDNARIHHYKKLKEYIKKTNIEFIYNVPYMPEFNPIELVFKDFKTYLKGKQLTKSNILKMKQKKNYVLSKTTY